MPGMSFVFKWLGEDPEFAKQYARAREDQAEAMLEEILEIADDSSNDTVETYDKAGNPIDTANTEWIQRSKLRVDARKWAMSKLAPKKYGDKIGIEGTVTVELANALEAARKRVGDE